MRLWLDIIRILVPGILLGLVVGKLVVSRPYYLRRVLPRFWIPIARRMHRRKWCRVISIGLAFAIASLFLATIIGGALQRAGAELVSEEEYPFYAIQKTYPMLLLVIVNVVPIFEEWIFRGILLEEIARRSRSKWLGIVCSALIFAVLHLANPGTYPAIIIPMFGAGLLLGACYLLSGLGGAIIAHNAYNTILVTLGL